mgnify:CR=1 FL=1
MQITFPVPPVPASRPRVTRWGVYYGKKYTSFRKELKAILPDLLAGRESFPVKGPISVKIIFHCHKPKTSKLNEPRGDIDNYIKAILDSCNGLVWDDDDQIVRINACKLFADGCDPKIEMWVDDK